MDAPLPIPVPPSPRPRTRPAPPAWVAQTMVVLAVINAFIATYLHLWKLGRAGTLSCATGVQCAVVQFSKWSWFASVDVALWGAVGYTLIAAVGLLHVWRPAPGRRTAQALLALTTVGVLMTLRLKYGEWIDLGLFCLWCLPSAVSMPLLWLGAWRLWRSSPGDPSGPTDRPTEDPHETL